MPVEQTFYNEVLPVLWRGGSHAYYWTDDDGVGKKCTLWHQVAPGPQPQPPSVWRKKLNVYFGIHPTRQRGQDSFTRARVSDIELINCLYAEIDGLTTPEEVQAVLDWLLNDLPCRPTLIIFSGGGLHVYWILSVPFLLDDDAARNRAILAQHAMALFVGGDTAVHDLARVLRVAGTVNHKPGRNNAVVGILHWEASETWTLDELESMIAAQLSQVSAAQAHTPPQASVSGPPARSDDEVLDILFHTRNGADYRALWDGDMSSVGNDHSRADAKLLAGLAWATGNHATQMDNLFRRCALMRPKWDQRDYGQRTIDKAIASGKSTYDPAKGGDPAAVAAAQAAVGPGQAVSQNGHSPNGSTPPPPLPSPRPHPLLRFGHNDEGNARAFLHLFPNTFRFCPAYGFLAWDGSCWAISGAESALQRAIIDVLEQRHQLAQQSGLGTLTAAARPSAANVRNCQFMLRSLIEVNAEQFDASPDHLNCKNGVVDLRTGVVEAHTPTQLYTYCVPVEYDPGADYVHWIEFLHSVVSEPGMVDYLQLALGYSITGNTSEECLFAIVGATRSGKGTLTESILRLLPKPLGVEIDFSTFTAKRDVDSQNFDLAALKPARFVAASESKQHETLNEAKVKVATGGNYIRAAFKHKDFFEYRPQFKIWLTSNHPIRGDVNDEAFWGRLRVIEFPNSFKGREDKTLKRRMQAPESLRGILAWLVAGAIRWYAEPTGLPIPDAVRIKTDQVRKDFDHVGQWLDECCDLTDPTAWSSNSVIWTSYSQWATRLGMNKRGLFNAVHLSRSLGTKGFDIGQRRWDYDGLNKVYARGVQGIKIR